MVPRSLFAGLIVLGVGAWLMFQDVSKPPYSLSHIEIAQTTTAHTQGLSGREVIEEDFGMLFIFPKEGDYGFCMKDMLIPIDIVWLSNTGVVLGIEDSVSPSSYPQLLYPPQPVKYVLETKAGTAQKRGWDIGTVLTLPLP